MPDSGAILEAAIGTLHSVAEYKDTEMKQAGEMVYDLPENAEIDYSIAPPNAAPYSAIAHIYEWLDRYGAAIWLLGVCLLVWRATINYTKLKRDLCFATKWRGGNEVCEFERIPGIHDNVYETDQIHSPFVLGFIHPKIYLPVAMPESEVGFILRHEGTHIRRLDYLVKPVAFITLAIHWFNPLVWLAYYLISKDMEMSCDESVLKETDGTGYSKALLSFAAGGRPAALSPVAFGEVSTKERIKNVLNFRQPSRWISAAAFILVLALTVGIAMNRSNDGSAEHEGEAYTQETPYVSHASAEKRYILVESTGNAIDIEPNAYDYVHSDDGRTYRLEEIIEK
jgi:beta-lactamase regulating signal transducer with metallopeptidase domain